MHDYERELEIVLLMVPRPPQRPIDSDSAYVVTDKHLIRSTHRGMEGL
jgi:hypothetical protein